jgi:DNA-binding response OmpR family regulator
VETEITILVVEDEPVIQEIVEEALVDGGFAVVKASTPDAAFGLIDASDASFRALTTDINLGRGLPTGWDIAKRAREINAELPIVYMTGDSGGEWASHGVPNSVLLMKPFAPAQLTTAVAQLLNEVPPT